MLKAILPVGLLVTLAACGQSQSTTALGVSNCTAQDPQAQSLMVAPSGLPVRCGPQQTIKDNVAPAPVIAAAAPTVVIPAAAPATVQSDVMIVVPNQTGPAVPGQITQAESDLLASQGIPASQENIDFIRLALQ